VKGIPAIGDRTGTRGLPNTEKHAGSALPTAEIQGPKPTKTRSADQHFEMHHRHTGPFPATKRTGQLKKTLRLQKWRWQQLRCPSAIAYQSMKDGSLAWEQGFEGTGGSSGVAITLNPRRIGGNRSSMKGFGHWQSFHAAHPMRPIPPFSPMASMDQRAGTIRAVLARAAWPQLDAKTLRAATTGGPEIEPLPVAFSKPV